MSIPSLEPNGFLPAGIHDCSLEEIRVRFGSFQRSDRRAHLFEKLDLLVGEVRAAQFASCLLIDGSFVSGKDAPNDIDLVLVMPFAFDVAANLSPAQYNLVSKRRVQRRFGFDILTVREETPEHEEAVAFFQQVRGQRDIRKGILRLWL